MLLKVDSMLSPGAYVKESKSELQRAIRQRAKQAATPTSPKSISAQATRVPGKGTSVKINGYSSIDVIQEESIRSQDFADYSDGQRRS